MASVGSSSRRKEGPEKLTGDARYIDDYDIAGALHGVTLRSRIARGVLREIRFDPAYDWSSVVVATAADIPGENSVLLIERDQPLLAAREIRHLEEPILVLGHAERARAYEALDHIELVCDEEAPVLSMEKALANGSVFKRFEIRKGDIEAGFREADVIVEGEYRVPHQEQAYIEPNGVAAWEEKDGTLVVMGSLQCPYYVHKAMLGLFPRAEDKIRVIQATTGGGFGGKEEYPNLIAGHAAVLALKAKRPVKIIYDRAEDMRATTKRHPARIRHRTGVKKDGTFVAQDIDVLMDGGAYVTLSPVVLSRGVLHATGTYECPNVRVVGHVVETNTPPNGAFRGFGAPQTLFAAEMQVEKIAVRLGLDPLALRRKNLLREGSVTATGQVLKESVGAEETLERAVEVSRYVSRRRKTCERWNRKKSAPTWRGVGLAAVFHGAGFTGSGEVYLKSRAAVSLLPNGDIEVEAASTEIGQGTTSILASIVADALEVPYDWIRVSTPDTSKVPNSGPTVASRTCMIVGGLLKRSAEELRRALEQEGLALAADAERTEARRAEALREGPSVRLRPGVRAAAGYPLGRSNVQRRCLRRLRLRGDGGRARGRQAHVRGERSRRRHRAGRRSGGEPASGGRTNPRRHGPGARLRSPRERDLRQGRHGERELHELRHPDDSRHAGDSRGDRGEALLARAFRRQGSRRASDGRSRSRGRRGDPPCDRHLPDRASPSSRAHREGDS